MSLRMTYFLQSSTLWQFATLLGPGKRAPPSPPKSGFCAISPYIQANMIGNVVKFSEQYPYIHLLEWQLRHLPFHFKVRRFFLQLADLVLCSS